MMLKLQLILTTLLFVFLSTFAVAEDGGCKTLIFKELNHLPHTAESYPFRVWYATEGKNAVKNTTVIDDLLLQLHTADKYFYQELKLTPPLLQPRYKQAEYIDVYMVEMKRGNGVAFDEVIAEKGSREADSYSCGIKMHINSELQPSRNVTPAHELFHLYQYANSMFKARWYLEGMARWVEQAFRGVNARDKKGIAPDSCKDVFDESYTAARYWRDLAQRQHAKDIVISQDYLDLNYSDGRPVFATDTFKNGAAVQAIFDDLAKESHRASLENDLHIYKWPEKTQRSAQFNEAMCRAIE